MKIAFIKVNMMYSKGKDALKPLIFAVIEKLTPPRHELVFYDERIENVPENLEADVIAFSVETFAAKHAYDLADKYKKENNIIVMGGFHPTAMEEEALEHADIILKGDAEDTWEHLIADLERNRKGESYSDKEDGDSLGKEETGEGCSEKEEGSVGGKKFGNTVKKRIYTSDNKCRMTYVDPNSSCYKGKKYLPLAMIQASRGCKFNCDFCSIKSLYPGTVRQKNIENIVREIKESKEKLVFFIDDNLFLNEESAIELFKAIKPLKKKWACQISLEIAFRDELLTMMYEAGCFMVLIGFESLNEDNLAIMRKSANLKIMKDGSGGSKEAGKDDLAKEDSAKDNATNTSESMGEPNEKIAHLESAIRNIYKHHIMIYGMFVLGYDYDTAKSIEETYEFAVRNNLAIANFNPLMILPGTTLFERMKESGQLRFEKWWLDPAYHYGDAMYYPKSMSVDELKDGCKNARYNFNTFRIILKRMFKEKVNHRSLLNISVFLAINLISRSEIHRKQGESL